MSRLIWRDANYHDKKALQSFECSATSPRKRVTPVGATYEHPRWYEWNVQELIQRTKPRSSGARLVRVGLDADGLGGVSAIDCLRAGSEYEFAFMALACRLRGQGGFDADHMIRDSLGWVESHCIESDSLAADVFALIDPENEPSKLLFGRNKFAFAGDQGDFEVWSHRLILSPMGDAI